MYYKIPGHKAFDYLIVIERIVNKNVAELGLRLG